MPQNSTLLIDGEKPVGKCWINDIQLTTLKAYIWDQATDTGDNKKKTRMTAALRIIRDVQEKQRLG